MNKSSGLFEFFEEWLPCFENRPDDVDASAGECDDGLGVSFSLCAFAVVEGLAFTVTECRESGLKEARLSALSPSMRSRASRAQGLGGQVLDKARPCRGTWHVQPSRLGERDCILSHLRNTAQMGRLSHDFF